MVPKQYLVASALLFSLEAVWAEELPDGGQATETYTVTGRRGDIGTLAPSSASVLRVSPEDSLVPVQNLSQLLSRVPGLGENGQGGLFQVFSVRGLSGQRVLTRVEDMPIVSERRAGSAASFLDPLLLGYADVVRGPASTFHGSGALGGVVKLGLRQFRTDTAELGYFSGSNERYGLVASGSETVGVGFSFREKNNAESPDGEPINDHFRQANASVKGEYALAGAELEYYLLASEARDVGRPSPDYPETRIVSQPEESHVVAGARLRTEGGNEFQAYVHPNRIDTETLTVGKRTNTVANAAHDAGATWLHAWETDALQGRAGIEYFGRDDVQAKECEQALDSTRRSCIDSLDASLDQWAALGDAEWRSGDWLLEAGGRYTQERQRGPGGGDSDEALTGFVGLVRELGSEWRLSANLGSGFRFPSLSEKWFTGTTARGGVVGNPDLEAERSRAADLGLTWQSEHAYANVQIFRQEVKDYIDRVPLTGNVRTYRNLDDGTIHGIELAGAWGFAERWRLGWQGQRLRGEGDGGEPLADIPTDRLGLDLVYEQDLWSGGLELVRRFEKAEPAATEQQTAAATVLNAQLAWQPASGWTVSLYAENLSDETYLASADEAEVPAEERRIGLGLRYTL